METGMDGKMRDNEQKCNEKQIIQSIKPEEHILNNTISTI